MSRAARGRWRPETLLTPLPLAHSSDFRCVRLVLRGTRRVGTHSIDLEGSAFRHWHEPLPDRDTSSYVVATDEDECFTSLSFKTDNINDIPFNVDADDLIWAGNLQDTFCGSHGRGQEGRGDRDRFKVEWRTGRAWFPDPLAEEPAVAVTDAPQEEPAEAEVDATDGGLDMAEDGANDEKDDESGGSSPSGVAGLVSLAAVAAAIQIVG